MAIDLNALDEVTEKFIQEEEKKSTKKSYQDDRFLKIQRDKDGNASVLLRFLPDKELKTEIEYYTHFGTIEEGGSTRRFIHNCPTTNNDPCPYCEEYLKAWREDDKITISLLKSGKRKQDYVSNVYVVKDTNNPDNEGKVFLFKYSYMIHKHIVDAAKGNEVTGEQPIKVFHPIKGANFFLKYTKQGKVTSLDGSKFVPPSDLTETTGKSVEDLIGMTYSLNDYKNNLKFEPYDVLEKDFIEFYTGRKQPTSSVSNSSQNRKHKQTEQDTPDTSDTPFDTEEQKTQEVNKVQSKNKSESKQKNQQKASKSVQTETEDIDVDEDLDDFFDSL